MEKTSIDSPFTLPCGLTLPNRMIKAALAEDLSKTKGLPSETHHKLYKAWAAGGWGCVVTGNVQVDLNHLGSPGDVGICDAANAAAREKTLEEWTKWAAICRSNGTPTLVQINHPGRQSPRFSRKGTAIAPSAIPLKLGDRYFDQFMRFLVFGSPRDMSLEDIKTVVAQFANAAKLSHEAGFDGVEIHGAHGYLLSAFLSPLSNTRTDDYGGTAAKRARIVIEVIRAIRAVTPPEFCVGIKINSADHQQANGLADSIEQLQLISRENLDYIGISGGTYERPDMMEQGADGDYTPDGGLRITERTKQREAFFAEYAHEIRNKISSIPLLLTGGFRTRTGMQDALSDGACDLIGIGRSAVARPDMPVNVILNKELKDEDATVLLGKVHVPWVVRATGVKPVTAGLISMMKGKFRRHPSMHQEALGRMRKSSCLT